MSRATLIQISVSVSPESEEAVSALLEHIFSHPPSIYKEEATQKTKVTIYLPKAAWRNSQRQTIQKGLIKIRECGLRLDNTRISVKTIRPENWAESWKRHFKAIDICGKLLIKPSWSKKKPRRHQAVVILDPGLSFGTGQHATTSFCLEQLVVHRQLNSKQSFLDIGTGSGILAIAAAKLGYTPVEAFDFDPESVRISRANARQNRVEKIVHPVRCDLTKLAKQSNRRFHLVCANLIFDLLIAESDRILNRLKPGGCLVLAGILIQQFVRVRKHYESQGLKLIATRREKEWQSGAFQLSGSGVP